LFCKSGPFGRKEVPRILEGNRDTCLTDVSLSLCIFIRCLANESVRKYTVVAEHAKKGNPG